MVIILCSDISLSPIRIIVWMLSQSFTVSCCSDDGTSLLMRNNYNDPCSHSFLHIPTNLDTVLHSLLTSSPLQALTLKVNVDSGVSPDSLVMTVVVVDPFTNFSPWKLMSLLKWTSYLVTYPAYAALAGGSQFRVTEGVCVSTKAVRFWTGSGVRAVAT